MNPFEKLGSLFSQLEKEIQQKTQISIIGLSESEFKFQILKKGQVHKKEEKKNYRINLKPNIFYFKDNIIQFIEKFRVKKLLLNLNNISFQRQTILSFFKDICFFDITLIQQEEKNKNKQVKCFKDLDKNIFLEKLIWFYANRLRFQSIVLYFKGNSNDILRLFDCVQHVNQKYIYKFQQDFTNDSSITETSKIFKKPSFKYCIDLQSFQQEELLFFSENWCKQKNIYCQNTVKINNYQIPSLLEKLVSTSKYEILTGNSIKLNSSILDCIIDQTFIVYYEKQLLMSLSSSQKYGFSIHLAKKLSTEGNVLKMIKNVMGSKYFISLQTQSQSNSLLRILDQVFRSYSYHSNYLIKINNQIQITSHRLILNTTNLQEETVNHIFQLLKQPGHYELVFYGNCGYLQQMKDIFIKKPFVKFNYFLPVSQITRQVEELILKMQSLAQGLRQKIFQFCGIVGDFTYKQLPFIEQIFMSLHYSQADLNH